MPAIPVLARVEAHMHDLHLIAANGLLERFLTDHYGGESNTLLDVADGDEDLANDMLAGICQLHVAIRRAMRERNLLDESSVLAPVCNAAKNTPPRGP